MNLITAIFVFYILLWPLYFRISITSLLYYSKKYNISREQLRDFVDNFNFPFNVLSLRLYQNSGLIGMGALNLIEKLDELKNNPTNFRDIRLVKSIIPTIDLLICCIALYASHDLDSFITFFALVFANILTLAISWRFGNKLSQLK